MSRLYRVTADPEYFADAFNGPSQFARPSSDATPSSTTIAQQTSSRSHRNPCGFQIVAEDYLYSGIDSIILVGDSTIMRTYMHIVHASDEDYVQKVAALDEDIINTSIALSSGRRLPVYFVRLLHVSVAAVSLERVFDVATRNSLIVLTLGSHDTSWLVFRRAMPGFRRAFTGNWFQAKKYWRRFVPMMTNYIANRLQRFEDSAPAGVLFKKPVVIVREHYLANCLHPKFSKYPLITRCRDLLMPHVIPFYRGFLRAMMATINVPTISSDALHPPCFLVDAGHTTRFCKRFELQMFVQAFRETRRLALNQGWPTTMELSRNSMHVIVESHVLWRDLAILITEVPFGYRGSGGEFPHRGDAETIRLIQSWTQSMIADMQRMLYRFDDPAMMEKEMYIPWNDGVVREGPTVGGTFRKRNYSADVAVHPYLYPVAPSDILFGRSSTGAALVSPTSGQRSGGGSGGDGGISGRDNSMVGIVNNVDRAPLPPKSLPAVIDVDTVCLAVALCFFLAAGYMILKP